VTEFEWLSQHDEPVRHLQNLVRINTTNPPGNETEAARYLDSVLRAEGYDPVILESAPGRGNLVARFRGDGALPPLLLFSHTDVVPVEAEHWTHPPFGGDLADGSVWGRGTLDMKSMVVMELMTLLLLARHRVPLKRDVIFAATADEEAEGKYGLGWLVREYPDLVRAEWGFSEFGGYSVPVDGRRVYPCQTAEKGVCWLRLRAHGKPGHAALPHGDNAVAHLARAVDRLTRQRMPLHITPTAARYVRGLSAVLGGARGLALQALLNRVTHDKALDWLMAREPDQGRSLVGMFHNTATPTQLSAGQAPNVIPSTAEAVLDGRLLPGFDRSSFLAELMPLLGPDVEVQVIEYGAPLDMPVDTPLFRAMTAGLCRHDPAAIVLPYMLSGATDAKFAARLGIKSYGFSPLRLETGEPFGELIHGHDERVPVRALAFGVQVLYEVVRDFCSAQ
jgi:acetylornithine deacetylase/succinyl-diaminopimelate desuccinylase-like protein